MSTDCLVELGFKVEIICFNIYQSIFFSNLQTILLLTKETTSSRRWHCIMVYLLSYPNFRNCILACRPIWLVFYICSEYS